jgi:hypothetical protein
MRALVFAAVFAVTAAGAHPGPVNLDKPGALAALQREKPADYQAVMEEVRHARKECRLDGVKRAADPHPGREHCKSYLIDTVYPGRIRLSVPVRELHYVLTVRLDDGRERLSPAK